MATLLSLRFHLNRLFWHNSSAVQRVVIAAFALVLLSVMFAIGAFSYNSFLFLFRSEGGGVPLMIYATYIGLTLLLALFMLSSVVSMSTLAYSANDLPFFFSLPVKPWMVAQEKMIENLAISAWGVFLLGLPVLITFGMVAHPNPLFYVVGLLGLALLCIVSVIIGSSACILGYQFLNPLPKIVSRLILLVLILVSAKLLANIILPNVNMIGHVVETGQTFSTAAVTSPLQHLLPSYLISQILGMTVGGAGNILDVLALAAELIILFGIASFITKSWYFSSWQHTQKFETEAISHRGTALFSSPSGLWEKREWLQLWRELRSASQIFFVAVLSLFYILVASFAGDFYDKIPVNRQSYTIASLLGVAGYVLATYALRFVFPSISLESQSIWLLWSSPVSLSRLLRAKWVIGMGFMTVASAVLGGITAGLLPVPFEIRALVFAHILFIGLMVGVIQLGIGMVYANFNETDPGALSTTGPGLLAVVLSLLVVALDALVVQTDLSQASIGQWAVPLIHLGLVVGTVLVLWMGWMKRSYDAAQKYTF